MGLASFVLVIVAMFVCSARFRRVPAWRGFALPTLVWALCAVGAFMLVPALGPDRFGIAQRVFLAVWIGWPLTVAARARATSAGADRAAPRALGDQVRI